ncbi:MAG: hypothetical protein LIO90_08745 [Bacteroidales bacterium]|nr:hypothetical protein [Bacteroidales bacterium]
MKKHLCAALALLSLMSCNEANQIATRDAELNSRASSLEVKADQWTFPKVNWGMYDNMMDFFLNIHFPVTAYAYERIINFLSQYK